MPHYDLSKESTRLNLRPRTPRYWHLLAPGRSLGLYVGANGQQLWKARYRNVSGLYKETTLGHAAGENFLSFEQATDAAERWFESDRVRPNAVSRHAIRYNGQLTICPCGPEFTVGHALRDYVEWKRIAAAKSHFSAVVSLINYHLVPRISNIPLAAFCGRDFHKLCLDVLETAPKRGNQRPGPRRSIADLGPEALRRRKKTMNALVSILRGAFGLAWENGEIENDRPQRCLHHLPNIDRPRTVFLSREECEALIEASRPDLRQLILGALYTGCRVQELTNLRVRDVAREGFGIYVSPSKTYRPRFVFLPDEGMAFFLSACADKRPDDLVFVNADGRPWTDRYKHLFRALIDKTTLPPETVFHCLRHTYASQLVQAGVSLGIVAKQLGHASIWTIDKTYGHLAPQHAETEIGSRFAPLCREFVERAATNRKRIEKIRSGFRTNDQRFYATIEGLSSWPRSNYSHFSGPILSRLRGKRA